MSRKITVGILAWNESDTIRCGFETILAQTLFEELEGLDAHVELVCVPNGCSDSTAVVAEQALRELTESHPARDRLSWSVHPVAEPGKVNAWNRFIHDFMDPASEYVTLADADVDIHEKRTLANLVKLLDSDPAVVISTTLPHKHVEFKERKSVLEKITLDISRANQASRRHSLCGQLYTGRAAELRRFKIPLGVICEDQFVALMVRTNLLASPDDAQRITIADDAHHTFEAYMKPGDVYRNLLRQAVGHQVFLIALNYLTKQIEAQPGADAGTVMAERTREDPRWLSQLVQDTVRERGWWVVDARGPAGRFRKLRRFTWGKRLLFLPTSSVAWAIDWVIMVAANRKMKATGCEGLWQSEREVIGAVDTPEAEHGDHG